MKHTYHRAKASEQKMHEYGFTPESAIGQTFFQYDLARRVKETDTYGADGVASNDRYE